MPTTATDAAPEQPAHVPRHRSRRGADTHTIDMLVVLNPAASSATSELRATLEEQLRQRGIRYRIAECASRHDAHTEITAAIRRACSDGCRRVIAVGGDGTVSL